MSLLSGNIKISCDHCGSVNTIKFLSENAKVSKKKVQSGRKNEKRVKIPNSDSDNDSCYDNNNDDNCDVVPSVASKPINFPVMVQFKHNGFWLTDDNNKHYFTDDQDCSRNSVGISNECMLYVFKIALRHYLLSKKVVKPHDIDNQNIVPHVVIRKHKNDQLSSYASIQNQIFKITEKDISIKNDFMIVELDRDRNLHMTMIFSKKIKERVNLLDAFKHVIEVLNENPNLIEIYANLSNFGENMTYYWYDTPNSFPNGILKPDGYVHVEEKIKLSNYKITKAGSIIQ